MHAAILIVIALAVLLGVAGQALASLTRMPAIVFLLLIGVAAGPFGLGVVRPDDLADGLPVLTAACVAVILFEGGLTLRPRVLGEGKVPARRLVTGGAAITLGGTAVLARLVVNLPWPQAVLFGSLVVVTGPTVIAPILRRVPLRPRLHAVLKSESILIDPVGVFAAALALQYAAGAAEQPVGWLDAVAGFARRAGVGAAVGTAAGGLGALLARLPFLARSGNDQLVTLGALGLALGAYALADHVQSEAGVMAVIVAGLILATVRVPHRDQLEKFKDTLTTLGVSVLFILLAANLNLNLLARAGWREAALVAGVLLLVRPACVFLSTIRTGLDWREKAYLSLVAPRGILAAAMASYCAGELRDRGLPGANRIELLAFLTISVTVAVQGGWAAPLARLLRVRAERPRGVLVVGLNERSLTLARELAGRGTTVAFADTNPASGDAARAEGFHTHTLDATDPATYDRPELAGFGFVVAATSNDAVNTLACAAAVGPNSRRVAAAVLSRPRSDSGIRAMPTDLPHREVVRLLKAGELSVVQVALSEPAVIGSDMITPVGPMIPLLVVRGGRVRVAVEGRACAAGQLLVGLVRTPGTETASGVGAEPPTPA